MMPIFATYLPLAISAVIKLVEAQRNTKVISQPFCLDKLFLFAVHRPLSLMFWALITFSETT